MSKTRIATVALLIGSLLVLSACDEEDFSNLLGSAGDGECEDGERCTSPTQTPTEESTATPEDTDATPTPTEEPEDTATPEPTDTPTPEPPTPTPVFVGDWSVIYHDSNSWSRDGGTYDAGAPVWMDILVMLNGVWYGPNRYPTDQVEPIPLPEGYRWECTGCFGCLANGEAWLADTSSKGPVLCTETTYTDKALLIGPAAESGARPVDTENVIFEIVLSATIVNP